MTNKRNNTPGEEAIYQNDVVVCAAILKFELLKEYDEQQSERIVDAACYYAENTFCDHLYDVFDDWGTMGHITRMETVGETIRDIMTHEKYGDPAYQLFNRMDSMYQTPCAFLDRFGKGAFAAVTGLFYAAANRADVEGKYLRNRQIDPLNRLRNEIIFF